jgi:Haspin like kinase domain
MRLCASVYQADTYRRMKKATRGDWGGHHPQTNCLWMHYLAEVMLGLKDFPATPAEKRELRSFRCGAHRRGSGRQCAARLDSG